MDKGRRSWRDILFQVIVQVIITALVTYIATQISVSSISIFVSTSIQLENGYSSMITINNYSDHKPIEDLDLCFNTEVFADNVSSNLDVKYDSLSNYIRVKYISPKQSVSINILTQDELNASILSVSYDTKTNLTFMKSQEKIPHLYLYLIAIYAIINAVMIFISTHITNGIINKGNEMLEEVKQEQESSKKLIDDLKSSNKEISEHYKQIKILQYLRIADLTRELSFWRDTIRKIVYHEHQVGPKGQSIFDIVTKNLRTFHVNEEIKLNADTIDSIADEKSKDKNHS